MRLKKINLKNIRSYEEEEIIFPKGSVLLSGDIGSGKTSVLLAIEYALFGLQPGQRGSSLLANKSDKCSVKLELEIDGNEIIIERGLKRKSKSISQDYAYIEINGERIEASVTEIKTHVLKLLNYPIEFIRKNNLLYRYTVYTPQEQMKQIILEDAESRLDILRHIFGIDKYKRIKENIGKISLKLREESRILQVKVNDLDEKKDKTITNLKFIKILKNNLQDKEKELVFQKDKRKILEKEVDSLNSKVKEKENFKKEMEKTQIMLSNKKQNSNQNLEDISELSKKINEFDGIFDSQKLELTLKRIFQSKGLVENLNTYLIEISSKLDAIKIVKRNDSEKKNKIFKIDICPTCLQDVPENHKHNILNETEKKLKDNEKEEHLLSQEKEKTLKNLEEERKIMAELEKEKSELEKRKVKSLEIIESKKRLELLEKNKISFQNDLSFLETHMKGLKESSLEFTKFDNLFEIRKSELKELFNKEKKTEIGIAEIKKELEITEREIKELEKKISEGEKLKQKMINLLDIENWLSGKFLNLISFTEKNIMIALRKEFTQIFNKWFSMLTTDSFQVYLDETFSPVITQGDFELDYTYLSGGERTAVALAYRLALNQIINSLLSKIKTQDLVILDEPTDGFSETQLDKVRDILQELNLGQLIIVSHEQKIEGFVDNIIRLKKQNGVSTKEC